MFMKNETHLRIKDNDLILEINSYSDYEDVEIIAKILKQYFKAEVVKKLDGPSSRVWFIKIAQSELQLHQVEGYGCFLKAISEDAKELLREINDQWSLYS